MVTICLEELYKMTNIKLANELTKKDSDFQAKGDYVNARKTHKAWSVAIDEPSLLKNIIAKEKSRRK